MNPAIQSFPNHVALARGAADRIEAALKAGIAKRGMGCVALSGGRTPKAAYEALATRAVDWSKVIFALADERCVPTSDAASNENLLRHALAKPLAAGAQLAPLYRDGLSPGAAASQADIFYAALHFDLVLLGMGEDGHTLSWFPGAPALKAALDLTTQSAVMALNAPGAEGSADRITLTRAALIRADHIALMISGLKKYAALEAAVRDASAPVAHLFQPPLSPPEVLWGV